ncbi:DUF1697 domain-containing protein [Glaciibacter flavus]|uniref:DUF1697 domain-containing protein n=1 Tax=Orlajensenia flava TaxID=2565934 RepID=UPI003AFF89E1
MTTWIALLRGVNVNGRTIRSVDLAALFTELGFAHVKTVLASGNVRFDADATSAALKKRIEKGLGDRFGYEAWIVLVTLAELEAIIEAFPFDAERDGWHPYVLFSSDAGSLEELLSAADDLDAADEVVTAGGGVLYWHNRRAVGVDSAFSKIAGKAKYRSSTTNRNLRTLRKLVP